MELYACGMNAHQQLQSDSGNLLHSHRNIHSFQRVAEGRIIRILCNLWCATILEIDAGHIYQGYHSSGITKASILRPSAESIGRFSIFGDLYGVLGALGTNGQLLDLVRSEDQSDKLVFRRRQPSWLQQDGSLIKHISIAGNGEVAVVMDPRSAQSSPSIFYLLPSLANLFSPTPPPTPVPTFQFPSVQSILSTPTSHIIVSSSQLFTFGSPLHPHLLARNPTSETLASDPHIIPFFGGIPIRKISTGGWICAAISHDNDLYVWGGEPGAGGEEKITCLPNRDDEEEEKVKLVDIEGLDVLDVGVGDGHMIALTGDGEVWVCGRGTEGQLGLGGERSFEAEWKKVEVAGRRKKVVSVEAAGLGSWVLVKEAEAGAEKQNEFKVRPIEKAQTLPT